MARADATGTVAIEGESKGLVIAYKKAEDANKTLTSSLFKTAQAWDVSNAASKRAAHEAFIAAARLENARQRADELDKTFGKAGTQFDRATVGMDRMAGSASKLQPALRFASQAAATGTVSVGGLVSSVMQATSVMGPWGLALSAAGAALYGIINRQQEAAEAARKHTEELKKQRREADKLAADERARKAVERVGREVDEDKRRKIEGFIATRADELRAIEDALAEHGRGKDTLALQRQEMELLEQNAITSEQHDEAKAIRRKFELHELALLHDGEKKITAEKEKQAKFGFIAAHPAAVKAEAARVAAMQHRAKFGEFESALAGMQQSGLRRPDDKAGQLGGAQSNANSTLRSIEAARAEEREFNLDAELGRIEQEKAALLSLEDLKFQLATTGGERAQIEEQRKQIFHDANMQRIAAEGEAEKQRTAEITKNVTMGQKAAQFAVAGILDITDARRDAIRQARLQGKTEKEAALAGKVATMMALEAQLKSVRNMAAMHAIEYLAKGIASQASTYGIPNPQSVGYFTAAGMFTGLAVGAGVGAIAAGQRADSLAGGAGSGAPGGFGGSPGGAANSRGGGAANTGPSPIDSQIPGSPTPKPKGMWQQQSAASGPTFQNCNFYGTPKTDFIRQITEGQRDLGYGEPKRGAA